MKSKILNQFLDTFRKINMKYVYVMLYDLLFAVPAFLLALGWGIAVLRKFKGVESQLALMQTMEGLAGLEPASQSIKAFLGSSLIFGILVIAALYLLWCLSRSLIWGKILNRKLNLQSYKKFLLLNLIWVPVSLILFLALAVVSSIITIVLISIPSSFVTSRIILLPYLYLVFIFIVFPLMLYIFNLTSILYIYFTKENNVKKSFEKMAVFVISKINRLYLPNVFMAVIFVIVTWLAYPLKLASEQAFTFTTLILLLLYFTWHKFYVSDLVTAKNL